jgi:hypothetical protein
MWYLKFGATILIVRRQKASSLIFIKNKTPLLANRFSPNHPTHQYTAQNGLMAMFGVREKGRNKKKEKERGEKRKRFVYRMRMLT